MSESVRQPDEDHEASVFRRYVGFVPEVGPEPDIRPELREPLGQSVGQSMVSNEPRKGPQIGSSEGQGVARGEVATAQKPSRGPRHRRRRRWPR
jgi:hypothetical protein